MTAGPKLRRTGSAALAASKKRPTGTSEAGDPPEDFADAGGSTAIAFNWRIVRETLPTVWDLGTEQDGPVERARVVIAALRAFKPRDEIEGMIAAQAVSLHFGAMECLRRSMIITQPADIASRLRRDGGNLARTMTEMLEALDRKRGKRPQVVRVERVVVQDGGRAFVGNMSPGAAAPPPAAIETAPTRPIFDVSSAAVPVTVDRRGRGEG